MNDRLLNHPAALCNIVRRIAIEAGDITLDYFDEAGFKDTSAKADGSPVTAADCAAEEAIEKALYDLLPAIPVVGEELAEEGRIPDLAETDYFWLVDPLDGTREFISGSGDYTVNIALIHQGAPVIGVVYAPVHGELYAGHGPGTAIRWREDTGKDKPIKVRPPPEEGLTVIASRNHGNQKRLEFFLRDYKVAKLLKRGSSLKICAIAAGKADLYPRLDPTSEWDTAAGDAVLRSAGGIITDLQGHDFFYGKRNKNFLNSEFIACSEALRRSENDPI